jgi:hypothetical protein
MHYKLVIVVSLTWAMVTYNSAVLDTGGRVIGSAKIVIFYPQEWIGKDFPLLEICWSSGGFESRELVDRSLWSGLFQM